jgi:hypothetical protein
VHHEDVRDVLDRLKTNPSQLRSEKVLNVAEFISNFIRTTLYTELPDTHPRGVRLFTCQRATNSKINLQTSTITFVIAGVNFLPFRKTRLRQGRRNSSDHSHSVNSTPHTKQMASFSPIHNRMNDVCRSTEATKKHYRKIRWCTFLDRQAAPVIWIASTSKRVLQTAMCDPNRLTAAVQTPQPIRAVGR